MTALDHHTAASRGPCRSRSGCGDRQACSVALAGEGQRNAGRARLATLEAPEAGYERRSSAYFVRESYGPGDRAKLVVYGKRAGLTVQIFRTGSVPDRWPPSRHHGRCARHGAACRYAGTIRMGDWRSGVYYAELRSRSGRVGYAPFVLTPRRLGEHRVAVVMPTNTWQAYNRRDADGDGEGDTWYEDTEVETIDLTRPFLDRGVPPHFGHYDLPFLRWLEVKGLRGRLPRPARSRAGARVGTRLRGPTT